MAPLQELDTGTPIRTGEATVTLTIDGRQVSVPPGTSVMAAAALIDNPIPKLCATDSLEAFGSCRLCLVEIDGRFVPELSPCLLDRNGDGLAELAQDVHLLVVEACHLQE